MDNNIIGTENNDRNGGTVNESTDGTDNNESNDGNNGTENWDDLPPAPFFDLYLGFYVVEGVHFWTDRAILNALLDVIQLLVRHRW